MKIITIFIVLVSILILLVSALSFFVYQNLTGQIIQDNTEFDYSYTKAICDETNLCQDNEVFCKNDTTEPVEIKPITGAVAQFARDWKDPRTEEQINRLC